MTLKVANILGLNYVYVILAYEVKGHDATVVDPVFVKMEDAKEYAKEYEKRHNFNVYTDIYEMEVR